MNVKFKYWINILAYISIILLATITGLMQISYFNSLWVMIYVKEAIQYFAYLVLAISAFNYAQSRRNPIYMILYVLAVIVLIVFLAKPYLPNLF
ncbi:MAG: hypothetical protein WCX32_01660 [Clostridia bacterium]|nr:hypothetical protein [Clostridia bacterium]